MEMCVVCRENGVNLLNYRAIAVVATKVQLCGFNLLEFPGLIQ